MDSRNPFERDIACSFLASLEGNSLVAYDQVADSYNCYSEMTPSLDLHTDRNRDKVADREVADREVPVDVMDDVVVFDHLDSVSPFLTNA